MKQIILPILSLFLSITLCAQSSLNLNYLSNYSYSNELNDIWGYATESGEYALVGVYNGVSVVDVTNPTNPTELGFFQGPNSIWRDLKTYGDYLYCVNESSGGLHIVNLAELIAGNSNPTSIQNTDLGFTTGHNIYIDENGILYVLGANFGGGGAMMFDLNDTPESPEYLGNYGGSYFHDAMVRGDTLWGGAIYNGEFAVVDVSDKANPVLLASHATPNNFTHNSWISDDGNTVFTTDEVSGAFVTSYDVSDLNNIEELDRIQAWSVDTDVIPHNTHVAGDFLVTSYYRDGVSVVDASNPSNLIEVAYYDSSPNYSGGGFNGAWGTYPFLPSGNILVSDIENGLFVLEPKFTNASFIEGTITDGLTEAPISNVSVQIIGSTNPSISTLAGFYQTGMADPGVYTLAISANGYSTQQISVNLQTGIILELNIQLVASGCMDESACNYNPFAVSDDGSCAEFDECGECGGTGPIPGYDCDGNCVSGETLTINMLDTYGDGWNGNTITLNEMTFGFTTGYNATETLCYDPSIGCFDVICDGGSWQSEVSWILSNENGEQLLAGGAPFTGEYCASEQSSCQTLDFSAGWTMFSTYIQAESMNLSAVFDEMISVNNLWIVKNYAGMAYLPSFAMDGIGSIEYDQGYFVKTTNAQSIQICGEYMLPEANPISLNQGWGMFSYLRLEPANLVSVFDEFGEDVVIIKNSVGAAYLPDWYFNGIGDLEPGKGYQIKMAVAHTLLYLPNGETY